MCKSFAPHSREVTTAAPHSIFYRLDAIPDTQPTSVRALKATSTKHAYNGKDWQMVNIISEAFVYHMANSQSTLPDHMYASKIEPQMTLSSQFYKLNIKSPHADYIQV